MNLEEKHKIRILLLIGLGFAIFLWLSEDFIFQINVETPTNISIPSDGFTQFALAVSIFYEMIPSVAKQFYSASIITDKLLIQGFSPIILGFLLAIGQLIGQMILYVVGMFVRHLHKGGFGSIAPHNHFFHQHHFLLYLIVPFTGVLGDAMMLYSGHQRINPIKIIPFLFVANLAENYKWIYTQMFNLQLSDSFS
jgi:membrane protein YqaA with SNARE-associated domain